MRKLIVAGVLSTLALSACGDTALSNTEREYESNYDDNDGRVSGDEFDLFQEIYRDEFGYSLDGSRADAQNLADVACDMAYGMDIYEFSEFVDRVAYEVGVDPYEAGFMVGAVMAAACNDELERMGLV